jgi:hypothetical protein
MDNSTGRWRSAEKFAALYEAQEARTVGFPRAVDTNDSEVTLKRVMELPLWD